MGKRKVILVGTKQTKHDIKKPITKSKNAEKMKTKKSVVKALGMQLLSSTKSRIVSTTALVLGMEVRVMWGDNITYTGKVLAMEEGKCLVHYKGWNSKHDEWVITNTKEKRNVLADVANIEIKQKKNLGKLKVIKNIKKGVESFEGLANSDNSDKDIEDENDPEMAGLCEYEKIRLRNIREREVLFAELKISEAKADLSQLFTPSQKKQAPSKRGLASEKKEKEILPARKSSRLSGGLVAEIERYVPLLEPQSEDKSVQLETLNISETFNHSSDPVSLAHTQNFLSCLSKATPRKSTISFSNPTILKSSVSSLSVQEDQVAKVVPGRIFSLSVHPASSPLVVAVGDKAGYVGLWDILDTSSQNHGVHLYQPHTRPVNCLSWDLANTNNLVSTSYDGTTRLFDTDKQEHSLLYGEKEFLEYGGWTSWHAQVSPDTFLISQGTAGTVVLVDRRVGWASPVNTYKVFDRLHPKTVSVHPVQNSLFLTANNKGGCYIFDTRYATTSTKLVTPVTELLGHTKSITSCQFSSVTGNQVVTMASDDKIRLFNTSTTPSTLSPQCQIKHNNHTGRWLTPFRASWHPTQEGMLVTGSMERPRQIEVWGTSSGSLDMVTRLRGEALGSVCSLVGIHHSREVVVGGNSSGRVHVFM
eukprot:GFUD01025698.1.p1 GENE.GFUD01025698.1~~GFUD01025698.1.p1  ORF type:complete len:645 (+),score=236.83 GFUD01025698.1:117-2051(+)